MAPSCASNDILWGRAGWASVLSCIPNAKGPHLYLAGLTAVLPLSSRKKKGHVIVDVCQPPVVPDGQPEGKLARPGPNELRRYTIRRALRRRLGYLPYRLARELSWGDLLPAAYSLHLPYWPLSHGWRRGAYVRPEPAAWTRPRELFANVDEFLRGLDPERLARSLTLRCAAASLPCLFEITIFSHMFSRKRALAVLLLSALSRRAEWRRLREEDEATRRQQQQREKTAAEAESGSRAAPSNLSRKPRLLRRGGRTQPGP